MSGDPAKSPRKPLKSIMTCLTDDKKVIMLILLFLEKIKFFQELRKQIISLKP